MIRTLIEWLAGLLKAIFGGREAAPRTEKTAEEPVSGEPASPIVLHRLGKCALDVPTAAQPS